MRLRGRRLVPPRRRIVRASGEQLVGQADRGQIVDKVVVGSMFVQAIEPDLRLVGGGFIQPTVDRRVLNRVDTGEPARLFHGKYQSAAPGTTP